MKKILIILSSILVGIFVILSLLDRNGEYNAEKMIWKTNQKFFELTKDPNSIPDKIFLQLDKEYELIANRFPNSPLAKKAYVSIARMYLVKKDYQTVRNKVQIIFEKYPKDTAMCAEATSLIGKSYELSGDWPNALRVYNDLMQKYPTTEIGLNVPLYIANYYQTNKSAANAQQAYDTAIVYYKKIASDYSNSVIEFKSLGLLANCYFFKKMWREGVVTLGDLLIKYPSGEFLSFHEIDLLLKTMNTISVTQLKDYALPIQIYQNFITQHPKHDLNKLLKKIIQALTKLKNGNVEIKTKNK